MGALTEIYVDPSIAADSGAGTIGDPYGDLQFALNSVTRDATNGNRFNIKAGTDEVMTAAINLTTYGTPTIAAPLVFQGYTSAAGDGGIGGISGGGSVAVMLSGNYCFFIDLHCHNCGTQTVLNVGTGSGVIRCEVDNTTGIGVGGGGSGLIAFCHIHNCSTFGINLNSSLAYANYLENGTNDFTAAISMQSNRGVVIGNIINIDGSSRGIQYSDGAEIIIGNSIYSAGGTGTGLFSLNANSQPGYIIVNNLVEGFSGTGGVGIFTSTGHELLLYGHNYTYNNATNYNIQGDVVLNLGNNTALGASPFTDAANDDFTVTTAVKALAFPVANFPGLAVRSYLDIGALQREEAAGGNTARARYLMGIS